MSEDQVVSEPIGFKGNEVQDQDSVITDVPQRVQNGTAGQSSVDLEESKLKADDSSYDLSNSGGYNDHQISNGDKKKDYFVESEKPYFNIEETAKRFKYLLGLTDLFQHFIDAKANNDPKFQQVLNLIENEKLNNEKKVAANNRRRKTEKEEDAELLQDEQDDDKEGITVFTESPTYVHGTLRSYQIQGLNWLISLNENNLSGILADEMGLGKTLQTISFLGYLRYIKHIQGPHLVVVPKSTLDNWSREFARWTPEVNTLVLQGDKDQRNELIKKRLLSCDFDVVITSYEIVIREKAAFRKFAWNYIVIDEAHRIKNEESLLSQIIRMFHSKNRLLITGTPLQNNLHELWALLNFILPDVFANSESFDDWFSKGNDDGKIDDKNGNENENEKDNSLVQQLHKVLQPFLLRRIKSDVEKSLLPKKEVNVYLGMSDMQRRWYQSILEKDIDAVNGANGKRESKTRLLNIVMQLRKCCNHPYLFEGAEPGPPFTTDEHLIYNSQKMKVLDKLLKRCQREGSKVLIFSQMSRMLDILEDYCIFRSYNYCRIDGQTDHADRIKAIDDYSAPNSDKFVFLLTTRAGGLGINLTAANVVVLYDSDWNPQADLQAMDRAHRIGQTKQVYVYRFITDNAIEEKILERASQKLRLDQLVIQQGRNISNAASKTQKASSKDELLSMIQHGAADVFKKPVKKSEGDEESAVDSEEDDIDKILAKSEAKTAELNSRYSKLGLDDLQNFASSDSVYEWNGKNFQKKETGGGIGNIALTWINPAKRERKENYSVDNYYRDVLNTGGGRAAPKPSGPKPPKQLNLYDHQFYHHELYELYDLEKNYYKKLTDYQVPLADGPEETLKERLLDQQLEEEEIKNARPLTDEELARKQKYLEEGFYNWSRKDFYHFIQMCVKYGKTAIHNIASEFEDKTYEDTLDYAKVFWENFNEIDGHERYVSQIENGEEKIRKIKLQLESLRRKISQYKSPLQELTFKYPPSTSKGRIYSEEEDKYLVLQVFRYGLESPDLYEKIKESISHSPLFTFDFFFQSRTTNELARRVQTLLACILKEISPEKPSNGSKKRKLK
ncbi:hypothetical protein PACTADRAFT_1610 [Pachysolen tannophilus NRRL Y-2460]|uniref:Uncharacterized protein n=1 Tax=Pachysolen tannophilus NRRL Y-2460 TaxID=669874 RepID=A0A1E4TZ63_PACTA|nr:hypothetical protein PACTADRAFT_1610 [Pachysolen tannophilus NRRL Y-2460]